MGIVLNFVFFFFLRIPLPPLAHCNGLVVLQVQVYFGGRLQLSCTHLLKRNDV